MKDNPGKDHLLLSGSDSSKITIGNTTIFSCKSEKLLGTKIDNKQNFKDHIESLHKKGSQKISDLPSLSSSMNLE